jgi:tRNA 2-thiouridine synthesizing protein B
MGILFIVDRADALESCLATADPAADTVLLIEDGVYGATRAQDWSGTLAALEPDLRARGLLNRLSPRITVVDDAGFVDLVVAHQPIVTWR